MFELMWLQEEKDENIFLSDFQKHLRHQKDYMKQHFNDLMQMNQKWIYYVSFRSTQGLKLKEKCFQIKFLTLNQNVSQTECMLDKMKTKSLALKTN